MKIQRSIHIEAPVRIIDVLAAEAALSRQTLKSALTNGCIWHETAKGVVRIRRAKKQVNPGDIIHIYFDSEIQSATIAAAGLIHDAGEYSIWDKPAGMFSQGSKWGDHCTLYRYAERHLKPQRPAYPVHRLDRATRGLMLLAHTKSMAKNMAQMFQERAVVKRYVARVNGQVDLPVMPHEITANLDGRHAHTTILSASYDAQSGTSELLLDLKTGRKHQIRRHLAQACFPVIGDRLYGNGKDDGDLCLQSVYLEFISPISNCTVTYHLPGA